MNAITGGAVAKQLKAEIGSDLATDFQERKRAIYAYIEHVFAGNDPQETPDGASWYNHPVSPVAGRIVNAYRELQGIPPNPFHPAHKGPWRAFDRLRTWTDDDGWMPSARLRAGLSNRQVESIFENRLLAHVGLKLAKSYKGQKPYYKLVEVDQVGTEVGAV